MTDQEAFDKKLLEILDEAPASTLISIPGVYEAVSEFFNNDVLKELDNERTADSE